MRHHSTIAAGIVWAFAAQMGLCWAALGASAAPETRAATSQPAKDSSPKPPSDSPALDKLGTAGSDKAEALGRDSDEALKAYARGKYGKAAELLEPAYRAGKAGIQDRLILSRAQLHLGRDKDALAVLRSVLKTDPENPEANSLTGRLILKAGKPKEALEYLTRAYRLKPETETAGALGRCYYELGNPAKAKTHLTAALALDVRDPSHSFLLGRIHLQRGSGALAEKYLLMAQEAGLDSVRLHKLLGNAYLIQHKFLGPVRAGRLAGKPKRGDVIDGLIVLGPAPDLAGQYLVATRFCVLHEGLWVLKAKATDPDGLYMAAAGWFAAGRYDLAGEHLKALMQRRKGKAGRRAWDLQAELLTATKQFDALEQLLREGKKAGVFDSRAAAGYLCKAAAVLRSEGKRGDAIATLQLAEAEQPTVESVLRPLAALHEAMGNYKAAAGFYARLVELYPDADDVDELTNMLKVLREKSGVRK